MSRTPANYPDYSSALLYKNAVSSRSPGIVSQNPQTGRKIVSSVVFTVIICLLHFFYTAFTMSKSPILINIADYTNIKLSGFNRYGYGTVEFIKTDNEYINEVLSSGYCSVTNSGALTNGGIAKVACDYDVDYLLEQGYEVTGLSQEVPVANLPSTQYIDLFDGVSVKWVVNDEDHTADIKIITAENKLPDVTYRITQSDEDGNVIVHAQTDYNVLNHKGYEIAGNQFDKVYHIGRKPVSFIN